MYENSGVILLANSADSLDVFLVFHMHAHATSDLRRDLNKLWWRARTSIKVNS